MQINSKKNVAMTLVELLLVLTILGTITALTLPGLKKHSSNVENAKLAQHTYSILEQALDMAMYDATTPIDDWSDKYIGSYILRDRLMNYLVGVKDCTSAWNTTAGCFGSYRDFKKSTIRTPSVRAVILPSGAVIAGAGRDTKFKYATFYIDVNNINEPNMEGVDVFIFNFGKFDKNCNYDDSGQWKLCPYEHAVDLVNDGWIINYW